MARIRDKYIFKSKKEKICGKCLNESDYIQAAEKVCFFYLFLI